MPTDPPAPAGSAPRVQEAGPVPTPDASAHETPGSDGAGSGTTGPRRIWAPVMVFQISVDLPSPHAVVTLREIAEPYRLMALPVGVPEASALASAWRGVAAPRPLTHELFAQALVRLGATIEVVRLLGRRDGVVSAEMELSSARGREVLEGRPTDCLTLAIRQGVPAPILVDERLFDPEGDVE